MKKNAVQQVKNMTHTADIVFEDEYIIAVNKAGGVLSQPGKNSDISIKDILELKYGKELFILTRLDRPVSGLLLLAKNPAAAALFSNALAGGEKTYVAILEEKPQPESGILEDMLIKSGTKSHISRHPSEGKKAVLEYKYLASSTNYHYVKIRIKTGRYHQIRVQMANIGCPVLHDVKYGARRSNKEKTIGLHSLRIVVNHPVRKELITIEAGFPDSTLWGVLMQKNIAL
jgi:23S rRNA pseudouridine1911/1915/1917 synthase